MRRWTPGSALLVLGVTTLLAGCERAAAPSADGGLLESPDDWPSFGRAPGEQHYSPLDQIDRDSVARLSLAWYHDLAPGNTVTAPVAADGKLFVTTGHSQIRAFDAATGELLWMHDSGTRERAGFILRFGYGPKGLAYRDGRVFIATHDGHVVALDAGDGKPLWDRTTIEPGDGRYVNGPPRVFDGKVIIGHGGADSGPVRGYVDAFDARTGDRLWRFYTVPGNPADGFESDAVEMAAGTWSGEWWRLGGGGTVWNALSYDPELDYVFLGTGNGYPYNHLPRSAGKGDNLFLSSIVALAADTGEYVWHYQTNPAEQSDYNAAMDMTLATLVIDGRERKVLMQAPKNGFFYVIDRTSGELISARPHARVSWATHVDLATGRPVEVPGYRYHGRGMFELWPGVTGAHSWLPQSFSPRTGLVYIPAIERASRIGDEGLDLSSADPGLGVVADLNLEIEGARRSFLRAWDPVEQRERWSVALPGDWPAGTMATAGDLVFQGRLDGKFVAYDAISGQAAWSYDVGVPIVAPPISFAVAGTQYVTVLTGAGTSGSGLFAPASEGYRVDYRMPRRVLTFALDGSATLPANPPAPPMIAPDDPSYTPDPDLEKQGAAQFASAACFVCHGQNAANSGAAPDLRLSPYPSDREAFHSVVREGALVSLGMPKFDELSFEQTEAIRQYLRARARDLGPAATPGAVY
jgi:quinohemoprotein ethanol dehydrogenase